MTTNTPPALSSVPARSSVIESSWFHVTASIPEDGLAVERKAGATEIEGLAELLDILAIERLQVRYRIDAMPRGRFRLTGELQARVTQACVVTLDPVTTDITDHMDVEFWPAKALPEPAEAEQTILGVPEHEPIDDHRLAVGRVIIESLAAALPQFPRAAGAELEQTEAAPTGGGKVNPFAALAGWKPKPEPE